MVHNSLDVETTKPILNSRRTDANPDFNMSENLSSVYTNTHVRLIFSDSLKSLHKHDNHGGEGV